MLANNNHYQSSSRVQYYQSATSPPSSTYLVSSTDRRVDSPHRDVLYKILYYISNMRSEIWALKSIDIFL